MCHTDIPTGEATPDVPRGEMELTLSTGERMPALEYGDPGAPGVLLVADVYGISPFYRHLAALLAQDGFHVTLPDFFFRQGPIEGTEHTAAFERRGRLDESQSVDDLREVLDWLRGGQAQTEVGAVGFCMGGTFVLDLASSVDDLVAVSYYGFPVPQATLKAPPPAPLELAGQLRGPVLAFWGEDDEIVGRENVERYTAAAADANPSFEFEVLAGEGHGFLGSADLHDPQDPRAGTWTRTIRHLREHLLKEGER